MIVNNKKSKVIEFKNNKEMIDFVKERKLDLNLIEYLFSLKAEGKIKFFAHPDWFMKMAIAIMLSAKEGSSPNYPLHFLWICKQGTGKTVTLECFDEKFLEHQDIIAAEGSTLKFLIPSYARNPPDIGALAKSNRVCFIDEIFRVIFTNSKKIERDIEFAKLNSLLEHRERSMGSGARDEIGQVRMTAKVMAATNPVHDTSTMEMLCERMDNSAVSRWFVYYQDDDHADFVERNKGKVVDLDYWCDPHDFISIYDYLQTFMCDFDNARVREIYESLKKMMSSNVKSMYEARYLHHAKCLMDGIVKLRCLTHLDYTFEPIEKDYEDLKFYLSKVVTGWSGGYDNIMQIEDLSIRERHLPSDGRLIMECINDFKGRVQGSVLKDKMEKLIDPRRFNILINLIFNWGLARTDDTGIVKAHYLVDDEVI
jgi:hypothetical protein